MSTEGKSVGGCIISSDGIRTHEVVLGIKSWRRMSEGTCEVQRRQMATVLSDHVHILVMGNFDDRPAIVETGHRDSKHEGHLKGREDRRERV